MASDRRIRRIERLLDEAEEAVSSLDWEVVRDRAMAVSWRSSRKTSTL